MSFLYPNFLWALFLLLIPILIHLFSFRRYKTVYFSRVDFLHEVKENARTGSKLKHLLVLISRLLFLTCLILAFAQPFIPTGNQETLENVTVIYIDNSLSMEANGEDGNLLNEAKNAAIEIASNFEQNEKIAILTADLKAEDQRFISKEEFIDHVNKIDFSSNTPELQTVLEVAGNLFNKSEQEGNQRLLVFSDFQKSVSTDIYADSSDIDLHLYATSPTNPGNIFIDSVWFETPVHKIDNPNILNFRIWNLSESDAENLTVNLQINNDAPRPKRINVPANTYTDHQITYTDKSDGEKNGVLRIETDQLFFDDECFFTYETQEKVDILVVNDPNTSKNLDQLYGLSSYYNLRGKSINTVQTGDFENKPLIIIQNVNKIPGGVQDILKTAIKNGSSLVLIPGVEIDLDNWNSFLLELELPTLYTLESKAGELMYFANEDPIYQGSFDETPKGYKYPKVFKRYRFSTTNSSKYVTLFGFSKTDPFMIYKKTENGRVFLQGSPIISDFSDFQKHALFGLTYLRIAETATFSYPAYKTLSNLGNLPINQKIEDTKPLHLINEAYGVNAIPMYINNAGGRLVALQKIQQYIKNAGFYSLTNNAGFKKTLAVNYDRKESRTNFIPKEKLVEHFTKSGFKNTGLLSLADGGFVELKELNAREYWRILLFLALLFLAVEIALLKSWKA